MADFFFPYATLVSEVKHCSYNLSDLASGCEKMSLVASMFISSNAYWYPRVLLSDNSVSQSLTLYQPV